ncbi:MAG: M23 family peptidase, partial [Gelidibacter sp.]|nr:M23 family peptidase [Gelidibacter sp.]
MTEKKKEKRFAKKLLHKYRLVILNEDTFEERFAIKLTRLNVFVIVSLSTIFLVAATTFLIAFTSLREFIPGYSSAKLKKQATELNYRTDSLQQIITQNEKYFASIKRVLTGDVKMVEFNKDS